MSSVFPSGDGLVLPEGPIDLPALLALPGVVSEETRGDSRGKSVERTVRVAKLPRSRLPDLIIGEERRGNCLLGQRGPERRGNALGRVRLTCSRGQCPRTGKHAELARRAQVRSPCSRTGLRRGGVPARALTLTWQHAPVTPFVGSRGGVGGQRPSPR